MTILPLAATLLLTLNALPPAPIAGRGMPEPNSPGCSSRCPDGSKLDHPGQPGHPADSAQARAVLQAVFRAAETIDVAALDTLYAGDSLTVIEGAGINRGWPDYRDHHLVPELREMKGLEYRPSDIAVHVSGNVAWALFQYTLVADAGGHKADVVGRGTAVFERGSAPHAGRWVLRHIQTSGRARRPTDPPRA